MIISVGWGASRRIKIAPALLCSRPGENGGSAAGSLGKDQKAICSAPAQEGDVKIRTETDRGSSACEMGEVEVTDETAAERVSIVFF